jgi:hypothetical protein
MKKDQIIQDCFGHFHKIPLGADNHNDIKFISNLSYWYVRITQKHWIFMPNYCITRFRAFISLNWLVLCKSDLNSTTKNIPNPWIVGDYYYNISIYNINIHNGITMWMRIAKWIFHGSCGDKMQLTTIKLAPVLTNIVIHKFLLSHLLPCYTEYISNQLDLFWLKHEWKIPRHKLLGRV